MDQDNALNRLSGGVGYAFQLAVCVLGLVASLAVANNLAAPAWSAVVALANSSSAVMSSQGVNLLAALGVLAVLKYLRS